MKFVSFEENLFMPKVVFGKQGRGYKTNKMEAVITMEKQLVETLMEAVFACGQKGSQVFMTDNGIKELQRMMKDQKILVIDFADIMVVPATTGWESIEGGAMTYDEHQQVSAKIANAQR